MFFNLTLGISVVSFIVLALNISYLKSKPLGMQTLPDIARFDLLNLSLLSTLIFLVITLVQSLSGTVGPAIAILLSSLFILVVFAFFIEVIIYQTMLYLCTFYTGIVSEWSEDNFGLYSRWSNIVLTLILGIHDILFYKAAQGVMFQFLIYGPSHQSVSHYGPGQMFVVIALLVSIFGYQIQLEVASFKSGEKVSGIIKNLCKLLSPPSQTLPILNEASKSDFLGVQGMRLVTLVAGSLFCILAVNVISGLILKDTIKGGIKNILLYIILISVAHPGAYILSSPKILDHSKRVIFSGWLCNRRIMC